jgi:hypothetical protein
LKPGGFEAMGHNWIQLVQPHHAHCVEGAPRAEAVAQGHDAKVRARVYPLQIPAVGGGRDDILGRHFSSHAFHPPFHQNRRTDKAPSHQRYVYHHVEYYTVCCRVCGAVRLTYHGDGLEAPFAALHAREGVGAAAQRVDQPPALGVDDAADEGEAERTTAARARLPIRSIPPRPVTPAPAAPAPAPVFAPATVFVVE